MSFSDTLPQSIVFHLLQTTKIQEDHAASSSLKYITAPLDTDQELNYDDDRVLYRQLVNWLCIEKYWYYVLREPKTEEEAIEDIERYVISMEKENDALINPYSPSKKHLHSNPEMYPPFVRLMFVRYEIEKEDKQEFREP